MALQLLEANEAVGRFETHLLPTPPPKSEINKLKVGDFVSLSSEREVFNVIVAHVGRDGLIGESCNDLDDGSLNMWGKVFFYPEHIIKIVFPFPHY